MTIHTIINENSIIYFADAVKNQSSFEGEYFRKLFKFLIQICGEHKFHFLSYKKLARFKQQFPDWVPVKPYSVLQSVMRPENDGR